MSPKLVNWIKQRTARVIDPNREERVAELVVTVEREMYRLKDQFQITAVLDALEVPAGDDDEVIEGVYRRALVRVWEDEQVSKKEQRGLQWISQALGLEAKRAVALQREFGLRVFEKALAQAMDDGQLEPVEITRLKQIAASLGADLPAMMRHYFSEKGERFLQSVFLKQVDDGKLDEKEWNTLLHVVDSLGLPRTQVLEAIAPQARVFVEHVLANAKEDQLLSEIEEQELVWLLDTLRLPAEFHDYASRELEHLRVLTRIHQGELPVIDAPDVLLKAGELAHYHGCGSLQITKHLKNGPKVESHEGAVTITDNRLLFSSETRSAEVGHRRIIELPRSRCGVEVRSSGRGAGTYHFGHEHRLAAAIYEEAIKRVKQTSVATVDGGPTRHIPRDVRQRVWQQYGGRCADCGADQYLEFDHIVPHARGGSNSDVNIQLLCRNCNLSKSDNL